MPWPPHGGAPVGQHASGHGPLAGRRVAVVGSGISGLSAAWLLHRNGAAVTLYEKEAVFGGHTLTDDSSGYPVDLGFQVYNLTTYPNLVGFFDALGVDTQPSDMSFALSMDDGKLEWGSDNLDTVFAQRRNILRPAFLAMLRDVIRFGKDAPKVLEPANSHLYRDMTLGEFLKEKAYSQGFIYNYVVPMCAAVWSVPNAQVLQFPVQMLIRFWVNHHLLDIFQRPMWRVVKGRSREYVKKVVAEIPDARASCPVASIVRPQEGSSGRVKVTTQTGNVDEFDAVVMATHSNISMQLLGDDMDADERSILAAVPYNANDVFLHTDASLMPRNRKTWSSWNLIGRSDADNTSAVCVTYWINRLQELPASAPDLFVTLNPLHKPAEDKVVRRLTLDHPVFSFDSVKAQDAVKAVQGHRATFYAGAWCGYGFHEDGIKSAVAAARAMGCHVPWEPRTVSPKMTVMQQLYLAAFDKFAAATFKRGYLRFVLPDGRELRYGSPNSVTVPGAPGEEWRGRAATRATVRVFDFDFFRKVVTRHDTGMGEAYMEHDFETDELDGLMAVVLANVEQTEVNRGKLGVLNWIGDKLLLMAHHARPNTITGSRKNIEEHYDAGNDMYKLFLDESMMYSCAIHHEGETLYQAQMNKLDAIIKQAGIQASDHVLEIGCGWGGFAIRAAATTGCRVMGITISKEQLAEATARVKAAGLDDRVNLMFCDYRDLPGKGTFDKVVSIEMIEAVGHEHLVPYFSVIGQMLKTGGKAVLQAISVPDDRYEAYCNCGDFIREHIFPGGHLPCVGAMVEAARGTGLVLDETNDIGPHYAVTLREWRKAWEQKRKQVLALGYSDRFWRKYHFYFVYCEAGFDFRYIHNFHATWTKTQPRTAEHGVSDAIRSVVQSEMPHDAFTQVLLAAYFFLSGLLVHKHPLMWLLPLVTCLSAGAHYLTHGASRLLLPFYRKLPQDKQAWWCADIAHLVFSCMASVASIAYIASAPAAMLPWQPATLEPAPCSVNTMPCAVACASAGFFAFHLWLSVRYRLYATSLKAIVHYTLLLVLFVVAAYKGISVPLLCASLVGELSNVPYLVGKLQGLAGVTTQALTAQAELVMLACSMSVHAIITILVLASPSSFGNVAYYGVALLGLTYCNGLHWFRARQLVLQRRQQQAKLHAE